MSISKSDGLNVATIVKNIRLWTGCAIANVISWGVLTILTVVWPLDHFTVGQLFQWVLPVAGVFWAIVLIWFHIWSKRRPRPKEPVRLSRRQMGVLMVFLIIPTALLIGNHFGENRTNRTLLQESLGYFTVHSNGVVPQDRIDRTLTELTRPRDQLNALWSIPPLSSPMQVELYPDRTTLLSVRGIPACPTD